MAGASGNERNKPRPGRVRLSCDDPNFHLEGYLGPDSPRLTGGFGGWNVTSRPRQVGMTTWDGIDPFELSFQMQWDGHLGPMRRRPRRTELSVEPDLRDLVAVVRGDGESNPGIVKVEGIPSLPADRWVITNVEFGDAIRRPEDMHRSRLLIDFTLLEYVPPRIKRLKKHAVGKDRGKTVVINSKNGDTPHIIAKRRHCKWTDLRKLNPGVVRKANQQLRQGTKLRVPARKAGRKDNK